MLTTYVGREPARFILEGQVRRGDIRTITAALVQASRGMQCALSPYGAVGSADRRDFPVTGADVNLASRIERLCRERDRHLILSEALAEALGRRDVGLERV